MKTKHMLHEDFVVVLGTQMQKLNKLGCPMDALVVLGNKCNRLWEALHGVEINEEQKGFYFFIPVIPHMIVPIETQLGWLNIPNMSSLPETKENLFDSPKEPYFITAVSDGCEFLECNSDLVWESLGDIKKKPLSDVEVVSLCLHADDLNSGDQIEAFGTRYVLYPLCLGQSGRREHIPFLDLKNKYFSWMDVNHTAGMIGSSFPSKGIIEV